MLEQRRGAGVTAGELLNATGKHGRCVRETKRVGGERAVHFGRAVTAIGDCCLRRKFLWPVQTPRNLEKPDFPKRQPPTRKYIQVGTIPFFANYGFELDIIKETKEITNNPIAAIAIEELIKLYKELK